MCRLNWFPAWSQNKNVQLYPRKHAHLTSGISLYILLFMCQTGRTHLKYWHAFLTHGSLYLLLFTSIFKKGRPVQDFNCTVRPLILYCTVQMSEWKGCERVDTVNSYFIFAVNRKEDGSPCALNGAWTLKQQLQLIQLQSTETSIKCKQTETAETSLRL